MSTLTPSQRAAHTRKARAKMTTDGERDAFDRLRKLLPAGATVYNVLDGAPSRSGMSRRITSYAVSRNEPRYITGLMCIAFPDVWTRDRRSDSVRVDGCGMDMGFDLAYTLARLLYGDGYALNARWL